ncbi:Serine/threonine-protein kinase PknF [Mycobacterium basiliense]|uniref:non-specific serine/threonine protein kinase n=1 Tax=Mycobacterium basiliense TaxID=2094119 RepID=A0A447GDX3_9MYCO|nr:serine/threonine-protein kinase [Mycobacterium basiliense]VDM88676.1 Serine/threonine-protein kinase PknF [Mycobacterium basiliense]
MPRSADQSGGHLQEGELFAGYTIVRWLGAGGMGEVYLAQHPRLPRRDALKILPRELTADLEFRQRINREADLAASLYNEHIVGIHDRGEFQGQLWISMDYVDGTDAARLLSTQHPSGMPYGDVIEIIFAVADALDYAHSRGLLHRDVKPANILLGETNHRRRILLADFGIAREVGEISGLTATNMLMGTTAYCAPEQLQGAHLDGRADQYALGCTAFHLLTGCAPFQHTNPAVVITQHLSAPPPRVSGWRPDLASLDVVIARALAKNPGERFSTCTEFAAALAGQPTAGPVLTENPTAFINSGAPPAPPTSRKARSTRVAPATLIATLVAVALVVVAAVLGIQLLRNEFGTPRGPSPAAAAPSASASTTSTTALRLSSYLTDESDVLSPPEHAIVDRALSKLYDDRGIRLWVVYVKDFGGLNPARWAENTMRASGFAESDAILAVATDGPAFSFRVPAAVTAGRIIDIELIRRERIQPAVFQHEWTRAALAATNGLDVAIR